jgi:hypothetical protein
VRHQLTFRGEDATIPWGFGLCTLCGALLEIEGWLREDCPGRPEDADHMEPTHER